MFCLYKNIRKNYAIFCIAVIILIVPRLSSCSDKINSGNENADTDVINNIDDANIGVNINDINNINKEQSIKDLYANAGMTDKKYKMTPKDPFNLTLSHNNYFYSDTIYVEIISDIEDAEIYYSLDSSTPSKDNVQTGRRNGIITGSREYSKPVCFEKTTDNEPYILKIIAYSEDSESKIVTHTYFVSDTIDDRFDTNTYVFSISTDPYNLYDYEHGILIEGALRDEWQQSHPGEWADPPEPANYNLRGQTGEREVYIEVLKSSGQLLVSQLAGIRVHGGWSRASDRKSLALYARAEYDPIFDRFYYPFFGEHKRSDEYGSYIYEYKTLLLRNGANDRYGAFVREEFAQRLAKKAGLLDHKEFAPAAVFLNGEYYGFFWLENFYNKNYFTDMYGGDNTNLYERLRWYEEPGVGNLSDDVEFQKVEDTYDLDNFMLYYAFEIYARNWDWPHNNRRMWRYTEGDGTYINKYYDGKFRMLLYDAEGGWGDWAGINEATIQRIRNDGSAPLFNALMKREDMQEKFCNQMFDLLNSVFTYQSMEDELYNIVELYDYEIGMAVKKKVLGSSVRNIERDRENILKFADQREPYVIRDMVKSFKLADNETYSVEVKGNENAEVALNTLTLDGAGTLKSCYFVEHSVKIEAEPHPGYLFDCWLVNGSKYTTPEFTLNDAYAADGVIVAELLIKPDDSYSEIAVKTIKLEGYCDMIELYNPGDSETFVENLYLSNDESDLQKFHIERAIFPAKSTIIYYGRNYADYIESSKFSSDENKEEIIPKRIFDFKIQPGETIYISDENGDILEEVYIPKQFNVDRNEEIFRNTDGSYKIIKVVA